MITAITTFANGENVIASLRSCHETHITSLTGNISIISCSGLVSKVNKCWYDFTVSVSDKLVRWPNFPQKELRQSFATERKPEFQLIMLFLSRTIPSVSSYSRRSLSFFSIVVILASSCFNCKNVLIYLANKPPYHVPGSYRAILYCQISLTLVTRWSFSIALRNSQDIHVPSNSRSVESSWVHAARTFRSNFGTTRTTICLARKYRMKEFTRREYFAANESFDRAKIINWRCSN